MRNFKVGMLVTSDPINGYRQIGECGLCRVTEIAEHGLRVEIISAKDRILISKNFWLESKAFIPAYVKIK
jgi:hypothetical protein